MKINLSDFETFIAVAKHKSFRAAGVSLGVSPSAVSHAIKQLEQRLKIRLLNRTTRSVSLTEAGLSLYDRLRPSFDEIYTTVDEINRFRDAPIGTLKIDSARQAAKLFLMPLVIEFTRQFPDIRVEIATTDSLTNIVKEGFDAGIRLSAIVEKDMIAVPIGPPVRLVVVATPDYFERFPVPLHPCDLTHHQCIVFRFPSGRASHWEFSKEGEQFDVAPQGSIQVDDLDLELDAVLTGAGIGYLIHEQVKEHIAQGRLISVLDEWLPERPGFRLYYPNRQHMPYGLKHFLDYVRSRN
ncbi:D-malate degradation protein R [Leminorella richardii]|uniref:D-malate degradation protein R n=1 Tax=Leminorella richardii TaxID=158841 RepID=A0A2X4XHG7_9GAMM|nr:LysR family transcriptional regulator [Leminorella richardii]SQI36074.1 D-malate degradation protein R [Leminorella richardii]